MTDGGMTGGGMTGSPPARLAWSSELTRDATSCDESRVSLGRPRTSLGTAARADGTSGRANSTRADSWNSCASRPSRAP